jgi:glycosyltransferase involved in cell wall biosynthesis
MGGGQRHLLTLLEWFAADKQFSFDVVCRPGGNLHEKFAGLGLPTTLLPMNDFLDVVSFWKLYRMLKTGSFGLVHAHLNRAAIYASLAARLAKVPVICTCHGINKSFYYRFADRVIAVSEATRNHLIAQRPEMADRISTVHNGIRVHTEVDARLVQQFRNAHYIKPEEKVVGVLGTLHDNKGQDVAMRALKVIPERYNVRLLIVGNGPAKGKLEELAKILSLGTRVLILPATEYVNEFLTLCDLVLVPSREEAFSLVVLEALLMRRPVIASRTGGIPEIIEDGKNGILFPPGDSDRLAAIVTGCLDSYRKVERMAEEGPPLVLSRFTQNRMGLQTRGVYEEVLRAAARRK